MKPSTRAIIRSALDQQVGAMRDARSLVHQPGKGWLRAVRDAIGMKQGEVAKAIGVSRQSYAQLETAEAKRTISLKSLDKAVEAMDCELIYFVVPRETAARTYAELAQIHDPIFKHLRKSEHSMALEGQAVGDLAPVRKRKESK